MNKVLVAVFDTEQAAFEGVSALKELHRDGDITLYASSVIVKDADGVAQRSGSQRDRRIRRHHGHGRWVVDVPLARVRLRRRRVRRRVRRHVLFNGGVGIASSTA